MNISDSELSPTAKSTLCLNIALINLPYLEYWGREYQHDISPFIKLSAKLTAYLTGNLQSISNLSRFHEQMLAWWDSISQDDSIIQSIVNLQVSALCASFDSLFDHECNDACQLVLAGEALVEIIESMEAENTDSRQVVSLLDQYAAIIAHIKHGVEDIERRPIANDKIVSIKDEIPLMYGIL